MIIGAHVSPQDPIAEATARGADAVQVFLSNPQQWKPPKPREDAEELKARVAQLRHKAARLN